MRSSDIKLGYIYYADFDEVRQCEFDGRHLVVVLKKNIDGKTFIVMPLTSASNGVGVNKILLGKLSCLPSSLSGNDTYAVTNQIRTINNTRFISLKNGPNVVECKLDDSLFSLLFEVGISQITFQLSNDTKLDIYKKLYENEKLIKAINLAYDVKRDNAEEYDKNKLLNIKELLSGLSYSLESYDVENGIEDIFEEAKKI